MSNALTALNARRTAILVALSSALTTLLPSIQTESVSIVSGVLAVGAGVAGYVTAYQAIGLTEKLLLGAVVAAAGSVAAGLTAGLSATEITVTTIVVLIAAFGVQSALPSTEGTATGDYRALGDTGSVYVTTTTVPAAAPPAGVGDHQSA